LMLIRLSIKETERTKIVFSFFVIISFGAIDILFSEVRELKNPS